MSDGPGINVAAASPRSLALALQNVVELRKRLDALDGDTATTADGLFGPLPPSDGAALSASDTTPAGIVNQIIAATNGCFPVIGSVEANHQRIRAAIG